MFVDSKNQTELDVGLGLIALGLIEPINFYTDDVAFKFELRITRRFGLPTYLPSSFSDQLRLAHLLQQYRVKVISQQHVGTYLGR